MIPAVEAVSVLMALQESFVRLYNAGDLDGLMETCYTEDAYLLPSNHPRVSGRPQIRQFFHDLRAAGMACLWTIRGDGVPVWSPLPDARLQSNCGRHKPPQLSGSGASLMRCFASGRPA